MARKTMFGTRTKLSTLGTDFGSVVRLNLIYNNPLSFSFILDKTLQLEETPITENPVELLSFSLFPDSFQIFHHNLISFELGNNALTGIVVNPSHPTSFSPRKLLEKPSAGTSAYGLKFATQVSELPFDLLDFSRIIKPTVRTDGKIVYSEVNAQNNVLRTVVLLSGSNLFRECEQEKTSAFLIHTQQAFVNIPIEIINVTGRNVEFELLPCLEQSQDQSIFFDIGTSWEVVSYRCSVDNWLGLGFLDHATSLTHTSHSYLSREFESLPDGVVDSIMQFEVLSNVMLPSIINAELQGFSVGFDSSNYFWSWIDSDFSSSNSSHLIGEYIGTYKVSPPTAKAVGIRNEGFL
jgi:hypothetical protein